MDECNQQEWTLRKTSADLNFDKVFNILPGTITLNDVIDHRYTNTLIRELYWRMYELDYIRHKFPEHFHFINRSARYHLRLKITLATLKFITRFNHYSVSKILLN